MNKRTGAMMKIEVTRKGLIPDEPAKYLPLKKK